MDDTRTVDRARYRREEWRERSRRSERCAIVVTSGGSSEKELLERMHQLRSALCVHLRVSKWKFSDICVGHFLGQDVGSPLPSRFPRWRASRARRRTPAWPALAAPPCVRLTREQKSRVELDIAWKTSHTPTTDSQAAVTILSSELFFGES